MRIVPKFSRRAFLTGALLGGGAIGASTAAFKTTAITTEAIEHVELLVAIPNLPHEFEGYRIGFLTDIHLGPFLSDNIVEMAVGLLLKNPVDLLLLGGDHLLIPESFVSKCFWVSRNQQFEALKPEVLTTRIYKRLGELLAPLKPPDGVFSVLGNHDGWHSPHACIELMGKAGVITLVNNVHRIKRGLSTLSVIGVDDFWTGIPAFPKLDLPERDKEVRVLLSHNPDYVGKIFQDKKNQFQLALCGHTHGGQIKLPGMGALLYNVQDERFSEGLYQDENVAVYTSRGIGVVEIPHRINCPPETTVFTLERAV